MFYLTRACLVLGSRDFRAAARDTLEQAGMSMIPCSFSNHTLYLTDDLIVQGILAQLTDCAPDRIEHLMKICSLYPKAKVIVAFRAMNQKAERAIRTQRIVFLGEEDVFLRRMESIIQKAFGRK